MELLQSGNGSRPAVRESHPLHSLLQNPTKSGSRAFSGRRPPRQTHDEVRPAARLGLHLDRAPVVLHDAVTDAQAKPGPFARRLGGEEGVEDLVAHSRVNPMPVVDDVDGDTTFGWC